MSNNTPELSPGWYPDRITPNTNRWWDGTQWTAHTQPAGAGATAAAATATPAAATTTPAVVPPADGATTVNAAADGMSATPGAPASPYDAPATVPGYVRPPARNSIAYTSFVFGILGMILVFVDFVPGNNQVFFGVWGIIAIILGVRALNRRKYLQVSVLWPEVVGIILGSLSTLSFLIILIGTAALGGFE